LLLDMLRLVFNILWDKAIPSKQRIKEIEQGLKREFIDIIRDPIEIRKLIFNLVKSASEEISSVNAFHLLEREGILEIIREATSEHNVNIRMLVDVRKQDDFKEMEEKVKWTQGQPITFRPILKSSFQTKITTLIVDSTYSVTVEMREDANKSFDESVGLATYSNGESNIDTYTSIFETLWMQNEYNPNTSQLNKSKV
jgi:hypothetical protein